MNRKTVIDCILRHVRERDSLSGPSRPLGELVPLIAAELRADEDLAPVEVGVVPIQTVAAFVDGSVTPAEEQFVCQALLVDNSVLAELIASVRAQSQPDASTAATQNETLSDRLASLVGSHFAASQNIDEASPLSATPGQDHSFAAPQQHAQRESVPAEVTLPAQASSAFRNLAYVAAACCLLWSLWITFSWMSRPDGSKLTNGPEVTSENQTPEEDAGATSSAEPPQPSLARDDGNAPNLLTDDKQDATLPVEQPQNNPLPLPQLAINEEPDQGTKSDPPMAPAPDLPSNTSILANLAWAEINGLLAQKVRSGARTEARGEESSGWSRVVEEQPLFDAYSQSQSILQTLPLSRAQCNAPAGGRMVLGPDSAVQITSGARTPALTLGFGEVVFADIPGGSSLRLADFRNRVVDIEWQSPGTLVVAYSPDGMQLNVRSGSIQIGAREYEQTSLVSTTTGIKTVERNLKLPRWVDGQRSKMPKHILGQFDSTQNLSVTLQSQIAAHSQSPISARDQTTLKGLAELQAALVGNQLLRMTGSRNEFLRNAAVSRLMSIPEWDPRYERFWETGRDTAPAEIGVRRLQQFVNLAREGKLSGVHAPQLLRGLSSADAPARVIYHVLLRSIAKSGPAFDANWTRPQRARAIAAWEQHLGLR